MITRRRIQASRAAKCGRSSPNRVRPRLKISGDALDFAATHGQGSGLRIATVPDTIRRKIATGELRAVRVADGGPLLVPAEAVDGSCGRPAEGRGLTRDELEDDEVDLLGVFELALRGVQVS